MHRRILIVGTVPYNKNMTSRAFDAYFHNWEKENIRQIFSNAKTPVKGHCGSLYQITDQYLLKKRLGKINEIGKIFNYNELPDDWQNNDLEVSNAFVDKLYKIGSRDTSIKHLARKWLWKKKYWNTEKLNNWLDEFKPECVFLAFSDDFFIPEIAIYVAEKYNIPIMSCIGDDYYFNDRFSLSPFYRIYRKKYKAFIRNVFKHKGSAFYISDKIRDKYNSEFGLNGETIYLTSDIERREFKEIDKENPVITYCGNIRLGRNRSLANIGKALFEINPDYKLQIYSSEMDEKYIKVLKGKPGIDYKGAVPYKEVMQIIHNSDIVVVAEGFEKKNIIITKYSLSTKAADAIASGAQILAYGDPDCGVIGYLSSVGCAVMCTDKNTELLKEKISNLINDSDLQKRLYDTSEKILNEHHSKERNLTLSEKMFNELTENR
jgi:glycosyltransferase involved in cell wall biosynthesis